MLIKIRKYQPKDREIIREICCETGFAGNDIKTIFDDRELFADLWTLYYTEYEPESAFVAEMNNTVKKTQFLRRGDVPTLLDRHGVLSLPSDNCNVDTSWCRNNNVIGYIIGCKNTRKYNRVFTTKIVPKIILKMLMGKYKIKEKTKRYFHQGIITLLTSSPSKFTPSLDIYPAHLHINITKNFRGGGIGKQLMTNYLEYLKDNNVPGVHLGTTSLNIEAVPFYKRLDFEIFTKQKTNFYKAWIKEDVYSLVFVKKLSACSK